MAMAGGGDLQEVGIDQLGYGQSSAHSGWAQAFAGQHKAEHIVAVNRAIEAKSSG